MSSTPDISLPDIDDLRFQRLAAAEGEELACELGAAPDAGKGVGDAPFGAFIARQILLKQLQIAGDNLQKIIEVVRDAAGELADGIHFLRLAQGFLGPGALGDFLGDALFERGVQRHQRLFGLARLGDIDVDADHAEKFAFVTAEARLRRGLDDAVGAVRAQQSGFGGEPVIGLQCGGELAVQHGLVFEYGWSSPSGSRQWRPACNAPEGALRAVQIEAFARRRRSSTA